MLFLTAKEAMELLRIRSYKALKRYIEEGKIEGVKLGRRWLVKRESVLELADKRSMDIESKAEEVIRKLMADL